MIEEIKRLEAQSRLLEPEAPLKTSWDQSMVAYSDNFFAQMEKIPVYQRDMQALSELDNQAIRDEPRPMDEILASVWKAVDQTGINPSGPGHFGYVPGGGVFPSAIGDYLAAVTNRYAGIAYANPGAVHMENLLIAWLAKLVGYPTTAVGNLSSGGSIATLIAMVSARDHHQITPENVRSSVIYLTQQAHHCILKALRVIGLDYAIIRIIPMHKNFKMDTLSLKKQIELDKGAALTPFMIVGSAGSTDVGVIDPLKEMGEISSTHGCWFHIDAAYGGFFTLVSELKEKFAGIEDSDSIVMDPHKGLFISYGTGAVVIKNAQAVYKSHHYVANYMQDAYAETTLNNPADLSPELTKHFRGLRMWMPLQLFGVAPFRAALQEKLLLAQYFYQKVKELGFEVGPVPELSAIIFRWVPASGDANKFNEKLVKDIQNGGQIFLSSTSIDGVFWPRICIMVFRTHLEHVDRLLGILTTYLNR